MDAVTLAAAQAGTKKALGIVPPSGDTTGVKDTAAFNAALTAFGQARGVPGRTYYVSSPIILPSHSLLDMTGCTVNQPTGTFANVLQNAAVAPSRTATDAQSIIVAANFASASINLTSADIGAAIGITGAASGGATWYGQINTAPVGPTTATPWTASTAVANTATFIRPTASNGRLYWATTAGTTAATEPTWPTTTGGTVTDGTVVWICLGAATGATMRAVASDGTNLGSNGADLTTSGGTISVFPTRDTDITVRGGTWNFCDQTSAPAGTVTTQFPTCFRRVDGIRLYDMRITQAGTTGRGGRFNLSLADVTDAHVRDITFLGTAGDGVHFDGPAFHCTMENIQGTSGDDMAVVSTEDNTAAGPSNYVRDTHGNVANVRIENVVGIQIGNTHNWNTCKLYGLGGGSRKFSMSRVTVRGVKGDVGSNGYGVNVLASASLYIDDLAIDDVSVIAKTAGSPLVYVHGGQHINDCTINNVRYTSTVAASGGIVGITDPRGAIRVSNLKMVSAPAGTNIGLVITATGGLSGASWGSGVTVDGVFCANNDATAPANFTAVQVTGSSAGTLPYLRISNVHSAPSASGYLLQLSTAVTLPDLDVTDVKASALTALLAAPSSTSAITARLANVSAAGVNLAAVSCPLTLEMVNTDIVTSGVVVAVTGANATPVRIKQRNCSQTGAGALLSRDGAQSLSVIGTDIGVDLALLTPVEGDMAGDALSRTGAAGIALFHSGGTGNGWKNLYTGATY